MSTIDIFNALKQDAYDLLLTLSGSHNQEEHRLNKNYNITNAIPHPFGIQVSLKDQDLETLTTLYLDPDKFKYDTLHVGYGMGGWENHQRRQFLFKTAYQMIPQFPSWFFGPDQVCVGSQLIKYAAEKNALWQIEAGRRFHTQNQHDCPLTINEVCGTDSLDDSDFLAKTNPELISRIKSQEYYYAKNPYNETRPTPQWKCQDHDLYIVEVLVGPEPDAPFELPRVTLRYAAPLTSPSVSPEKIDELNKQYSIYLDAAWQLHGDLPGIDSFHLLLPFELLLEIEAKQKEDPQFFDYLSKQPDKDSPAAPASIFDSHKAVELPNSSHSLFVPKNTTTYCRCSTQTIFSHGCQCQAAEDIND